MNERLPHLGIIVLTSCLVAVLSGFVSAEVIVTSGVECNGVNEFHKARAEWRQYGIVNKEENKELWVSCPLDRIQGLPSSPRDFSAALSLFHRGTGDERPESATCYLMEISGYKVVKARNQSVSLPAGEQKVIGFCGAEPRDWSSSFTFICKLSPGVGISTLMTESHISGLDNSILAQQIEEFSAACVDDS